MRPYYIYKAGDDVKLKHISLQNIDFKLPVLLFVAADKLKQLTTVVHTILFM